MSKIPFDIHRLEKAAQGQVCQTFKDFYHSLFKEREKLTFVQVHFLPDHGGHTIVFKERNLDLQEEENTNILNSLGDDPSSASEE